MYSTQMKTDDLICRRTQQCFPCLMCFYNIMGNGNISVVCRTNTEYRNIVECFL